MTQPDLSCSFGTHRNFKVIFCRFAYNPAQLKAFKSEFPSAKWSRTHQCWYLPDSVLFRKRLDLPVPEVGDTLLPKIYAFNQLEFVKFRSALQQKMFSSATIKTYLNEFAQLLILLKNHPVQSLTSEKLNSYFLYCIKKLNHSESQVYSRMNAIKSYFSLVLNRQEVFDTVIRPKAPKSLPVVLTQYEIKKIFSSTDNLKHLLILKMAYGMGLRVSELINIKPGHIDLDMKNLRVEGAKGKKDRYVNFPVSLQSLYLDYLKAYQPSEYLFQGQFHAQYTTRSVQAIFKTAMRKSGINKKVGIHGLRHSYATHLLEAGTDMVFIQKLLGHNHMKTTEIYAKVSNKHLANVVSPLDQI